MAPAGPRGLLLSLWYSGAFAVRGAVGDADEGAVVEDAGRSACRVGLSWGAGDGAMAMAALMVDEERTKGAGNRNCARRWPQKLQ